MLPRLDGIADRRPQQAQGLGRVAHLPVAVRNQPCRQVAFFCKDIAETAAGDQAAALFAEQQHQSPRGISSLGLLEMLGERRHLGVGAVDAVKLIQQCPKGLHAITATAAILSRCSTCCRNCCQNTPSTWISRPEAIGPGRSGVIQ